MAEVPAAPSWQWFHFVPSCENFLMQLVEMTISLDHLGRGLAPSIADQAS